MSSNSVMGISPTPSRNRRQEETFRRVLVAAREMLRESSYADLTVRAVAKRANVAPATAYTYFSSKNHLVAEVYLDLVNHAPYFTDVNDTLRTRVDSVLRHLTLVVADEPEVAAACTTALMSGNDDAVVAVRNRIGAEGQQLHAGARVGAERIGLRAPVQRLRAGGVALQPVVAEPDIVIEGGQRLHPPRRPAKPDPRYALRAAP